MSLNAQKTREFFPNVLRRIKLRTRLFVTFFDYFSCSRHHDWYFFLTMHTPNP